MIDTMGFIIPIPYEMYYCLTSKSIMTQRIDCIDGNVEFEYFNFDTSYSWNYRVKWKLDDKKFVHDPGLKKTFLESGFPHLRFEFSAPKIVLGNNIQTITKEFADVAVHTVWKQFEKTFDVKLSSPEHWFLNRLDVCSNFVLPSEKVVEEIFNYFQYLNYARKDIKKEIYASSIYYPTRYSTFKVYHKGPEFKEHDMKRFKNQFIEDEFKGRRLLNEGKRLLDIAKNIIRCEGELKGRLQYINTEYLNSCVPLRAMKEKKWNGYLTYYRTMELFDCQEELERMIKNFMITKETKVMKAKQVHDRLRQNFTLEQADVFMGIYSVILTQGLKAARKIYTNNKMARALRAYHDLSISFINSDAPIIDTGLNVPYDFSFNMTEENPYYQIPLKEAA